MLQTLTSSSRVCCQGWTWTQRSGAAWGPGWRASWWTAQAWVLVGSSAPPTTRRRTRSPPGTPHWCQTRPWWSLMWPFRMRNRERGSLQHCHIPHCGPQPWWPHQRPQPAPGQQMFSWQLPEKYKFSLCRPVMITLMIQSEYLDLEGLDNTRSLQTCSQPQTVNWDDCSPPCALNLSLRAEQANSGSSASWS